MAAPTAGGWRSPVRLGVGDWWWFVEVLLNICSVYAGGEGANAEEWRARKGCNMKGAGSLGCGEEFGAECKL